MIHIQTQDWKDWIQVLIIDVDNFSSVKLCIPIGDDNLTNVADACIYDLFVCDKYRGHGVGTKLLTLAEEQARLRGLKTVELRYNKNKAEKFVLNWYLRHNYEMYGEMCSWNVYLLTKNLRK